VPSQAELAIKNFLFFMGVKFDLGGYADGLLAKSDSDSSLSFNKINKKTKSVYRLFRSGLTLEISPLEARWVNVVVLAQRI
jgi:hypothetical protein